MGLKRCSEGVRRSRPARVHPAQDTPGPVASHDQGVCCPLGTTWRPSASGPLQRTRCHSGGPARLTVAPGWASEPWSWPLGSAREAGTRGRVCRGHGRTLELPMVPSTRGVLKCTPVGTGATGLRVTRLSDLGRAEFSLQPRLQEPSISWRELRLQVTCDR